MLVRTSLWLVAMGGLLFLAAGDPGWPQAWVFLGEVGAFTFAIGFWLAGHDPALLKARLASPLHRDQKPWDRAFIVLAGMVFIGWMAFIALDARRFRWSHVPLSMQGVGVLLIAL